MRPENIEKKSVKKTNQSVASQAGPKTYEFNIAGMPYRLKSSLPEETVNQLVKYVDQKVSQSLKATRSGSFQSSAILAALNIAEELILLKDQARGEIELIENKIQKISQTLEKT